MNSLLPGVSVFPGVSVLQGLLYVSSYSGLVEVPVANCSNYQSCGECVLSRDPYCAWTGRLCRDVRMAPPDRYALTDEPLRFHLLNDAVWQLEYCFFKLTFLSQIIITFTDTSKDNCQLFTTNTRVRENKHSCSDRSVKICYKQTNKHFEDAAARTLTLVFVLSQ